jgi:hypothetical protein
VRRRWDWIQTHQPLPDPKVLARYAKGKAVGQWEHLYGTEFSEEMDRALEGRPGRAFWRVALQMLGGGVAVLALLDLVRGRVVPGREWGAAIFLMGGLLVFWLASRLLREKDR